MDLELEAGIEFYYADRSKQVPIKCKVVRISYGFPSIVYAIDVETNESVTCYAGFGCYSLEDYDEALEDAKKSERRKIY